MVQRLASAVLSLVGCAIIAMSDDWIACLPEEKLSGIVSRLQVLESECKSNGDDLKRKSLQIVALQAENELLHRDMRVLREQVSFKAQRVEVLQVQLDASQKQIAELKQVKCFVNRDLSLAPSIRSVSDLWGLLEDINATSAARGWAASLLMEFEMFALVSIPVLVADQALSHILYGPGIEWDASKNTKISVLESIRRVARFAEHKPQFTLHSRRLCEAFPDAGRAVMRLIGQAAPVLSSLPDVPLLLTQVIKRGNEQELHVHAIATMVHAVQTKTFYPYSPAVLDQLQNTGCQDYLQGTLFNTLLHRVKN